MKRVITLLSVGLGTALITGTLRALSTSSHEPLAVV